MLGNLYLAALVLGGLLLAASLVGDVLDLDGDIDTDTSGNLHILTLRGATYFLFVFGAIGAGLDRFTGTAAPVGLALAVMAGVVTASLVGRVFDYVRRTSSGDVASDSTLHGLPAEVVIPISLQHGGKVSLRRGAERLELLARPFDERDGDPAHWTHVRIIDVREGTALVSPTTDLPTTPTEEA
ncbi:hypothetical protein BH23GEM10_BH23GEM10_16640 [soil metagenome]